MATITVQGTVYRSGTNKYGAWAIVREPVVKNDGNTRYIYYKCEGGYGVTQPPIDELVEATGHLVVRVQEKDNRYYPDIEIHSAHFTLMDSPVDEISF